MEVRVLDVTPPGWGRELIASYLIVGGEKAALIDVGPRSSFEKLSEQLSRIGVKPDYVIVTHIHLDHAGAAGDAARVYGSRIIVHPRGLKHLANPSKLWNAARQVLGEVAEVYGEPLPVPGDMLVEALDGARVDLGGVELKILHTPGHASHHMSVNAGGEILFTGDSAGVHITVDGSVVELPTTPPPIRLDLYLESIDKMRGEGAERCAPAHYGIVEEKCDSYLERQREQILRWYRAVEELVAQGVDSVEEAARRLAEKFPDAARAYANPNPIVSRVFYYGTVWGLLDAALRSRGSST